MTNFDVLPYAFEVARMANGNPPKFAMRYDDYEKYVRMFEEMSEEDRAGVVSRVRDRLVKQRKQQQQ